MSYEIKYVITANNLRNYERSPYIIAVKLFQSKPIHGKIINNDIWKFCDMYHFVFPKRDIFHIKEKTISSRCE